MLFDDDSINLARIKNTDYYLRKNMEIHYSQPKGFVGRDICFAILCNGDCYGHIVAGSSTANLPNRKEFFPDVGLNNIINNVFFHIEPIEGKYPKRNFTQKVIKDFRLLDSKIWEYEYGDKVLGFETLVEPPRTGECYIRDGWIHIGTTKGWTCKRVSSKNNNLKPDAYGSSRLWDYDNLRPKLVFVRTNK